MKIKRYEANSEQEAIEKVKDDLGLNALILNIKKTQPKGVFAFFRKPLVEVTAAYEEKGNDHNFPEKTRQKEENLEKKEETEVKFSVHRVVEKEEKEENEENASEDQEVFDQQIKTIRDLEKKLMDAEGLLEKAVSQLSLAHLNRKDVVRQYENNLIQIFYNALTEQGVQEDIARIILEDIGETDAEDAIDLNMIVKVVYSKIINILGEVQALTVQPNANEKPKIVTFIGPTGVGKTTVIAKLTSIMILERKLEVGLITADTYRIAAVEQLRTYADILGIEVGVVYNPEDLTKHLKNLKKTKDIIMIDTAGRSHRSQENLEELQMLLSKTPESERFLVLSTTTKSEDLVQIVEAYSSITDFRLIFTKLDETSCLGSILNVCFLTGSKLSYMTNGQNVPDDIEIVKPEKIARALMGLEA